MAAAPREIIAELERLEPTVLRAYLAEVSRLVSEASASQIERMLRIGDVGGVITALRLDDRTLSEVLEAIRNVYIGGGRFEVAALRPPRGAGVARLRFDVRNMRAESWLRTESSRFVTAIGSEQREAIRYAVSEGTRIGRNPRQTALDIIGRVNPQTGRRDGGIVGLTGNQSRFVTNAREQLLSGDPNRMQGYLNRQRRDRRFDATVRKAINAGRPVPKGMVDRIVGRYADRLLMLRGENIARTESLSAFNAGAAEVYEQAIESGQIRSDALTESWVATRDGRTRDAHAAMSGQSVRHGQPFQSPTGAMLRYPGDTSLGAGAEDVVNCRCVVRRRVDWLAQGLG